MTLTTTNIFGEEVDYPKTNFNESDQEQEQKSIADTLTGNLFLQDFVEINKSEISYLFQS
jgi:hypothetical protein